MSRLLSIIDGAYPEYNLTNNDSPFILKKYLTLHDYLFTIHVVQPEFVSDISKWIPTDVS